MWQNIIVALSNFTVIYPIVISYSYSDHLTCAIVSFMAIFSFLSHLVENHKHGMKGIDFSKTTSYVLNRFDVIAAFTTAVRMSYLYYSKYGMSFVIFSNPLLSIALLWSFVFGQISEYDKYNAKLQNRYIITHCIWHLSIFYLTGFFLERFIVCTE